MTEQHEFDPWPDKVSFDWEGNPVVQICLAVVDGQLCRQPYSDSVHPAGPLATSGPFITEDPWTGWIKVGATEQR
jgi:hypothetical protein